MAITGRADVIGTVPTIIAREILHYTQPNLEMANRVTTRFGQYNTGDRVQIPVWNDQTTPLSGTTAPTQLATGTSPFSGTAEADTSGFNLTYTDQAVTSATIYISQWWYTAFELSAFAEATAQGDLASLFRQGGVDALSTEIDYSLCSLISGVTNTVGSPGTALVDSVVLAGMKTLDLQNVPPDRRSFIFSAEEKANLFTVDKYVNAMTRGDTQPLTKGTLGDLYGMSWGWTTQLPVNGTGHRNIMFHEDAFALAQRQPVIVDVFAGPDGRLFTNRIVATAIWGAGVLRNRFACQVQGV